MSIAACAGKLTVAEDDPPPKKDCGNPCAANICPNAIRCAYRVDSCHPVCEGDYTRPPPTVFQIQTRAPYFTP